MGKLSDVSADQRRGEMVLTTMVSPKMLNSVRRFTVYLPKEPLGPLFENGVPQFVGGRGLPRLLAVGKAFYNCLEGCPSHPPITLPHLLTSDHPKSVTFPGIEHSVRVLSDPTFTPLIYAETIKQVLSRRGFEFRYIPEPLNLEGCYIHGYLGVVPAPKPFGICINNP